MSDALPRDDVIMTPSQHGAGTPAVSEDVLAGHDGDSRLERVDDAHLVSSVAIQVLDVGDVTTKSYNDPTYRSALYDHNTGVNEDSLKSLSHKFRSLARND